MAETGAVVVTGASTGIGEATATWLCEIGFEVFAGVRKPADGERLGAKGLGRLRPLILDVADGRSIARAAEEVEAAVGARGLAGLVNNAGISGGAPLEFTEVDEIRRMFEVNVFGLISTTQAFLPSLRRRRGRIVCMGSISGRMAVPFLAPYSASKAAVQSICHCLRVELSPWGIRVALIEPGSVSTPIWEKGTAGFEQRLTRAPPALTELYGPVLAPLIKATEKTAAAGIPPARVAKAVAHALTAARPKTRYLVGTDAKVQAVLGRMPDRLRDTAVTRLLGLPR